MCVLLSPRDRHHGACGSAGAARHRLVELHIVASINTLLPGPDEDAEAELEPIKVGAWAGKFNTAGVSIAPDPEWHALTAEAVATKPDFASEVDGLLDWMKEIITDTGFDGILCAHGGDSYDFRLLALELAAAERLLPARVQMCADPAAMARRFKEEDWQEWTKGKPVMSPRSMVTFETQSRCEAGGDVSDWADATALVMHGPAVAAALHKGKVGARWLDEPSRARSRRRRPPPLRQGSRWQRSERPPA